VFSPNEENKLASPNETSLSSTVQLLFQSLAQVKHANQA
jgi:hypothetical protein